MNVKEHPRRRLKKSWIDCLRAEAPAAEASGQLTRKQLALFYEQGWFKALAPKKYGGLQWDLSRVVRFEEAIGWAEGSAGWTFTLCSGAGWFGGFMEPGFAQKAFQPKRACLAGSGGVGGHGLKDHAGSFLVVDGYWKYATGAPHATLFTANYLLDKNKGKGKGKGKGKDMKVNTYGFLPAEVTVHNNWTTTGLKASASWAFSVRQVTINPDRGFSIDPDHPFIDAVLYRFPFLALAEATIAANLSGMALHFLEETEKLWKSQGKIKGSSRQLKEGEGPKSSDYVRYLDRQSSRWQARSSALHQAVGSLELLLESACQKNSLKNGPNKTWKNITRTKRYAQKSGQVSKAAQALARECRRIVVDVYGHTGLTGANQETPLNKVWRDFQTGSQHALFEESLK